MGRSGSQEGEHGHELKPARDTLSAIWSRLFAITTALAGQTNGQIAVAALSASLLPETPHVLIELWKANHTYSLVSGSHVFALCLLAATPDEANRRSLTIVRALGFQSGRDAAKLADLPWRPGVTGSPILSDALSYVEAGMVGALDGGELKAFLGLMVVGERLRKCLRSLPF